MNWIKKIVARLFFKAEKVSAEFKQSTYREIYNIDKSFRFNGKRISIHGKGQINFGANSYVGESSAWQAYKGCQITIGRGCRISHRVRAYTYSNNADADFSLQEIPKKMGDVLIGNYVWIGANVIINPGIRIGDNSVIGANSVVTKDIPENAIYGGVPAKLIRMKRNIINA